MLRTGSMLISVQGALGAGLWLVLIYVFCCTWKRKPKEGRSSPNSHSQPQRSIHRIDALFEELIMQSDRETAIHGQTEADNAGGGRRTSASREYHIECKRNGGIIKAGTVAAVTMSEAATASVRHLQKMEGGYVKKGSPAAKLASSEATRLRTFETPIPSP